MELHSYVARDAKALVALGHHTSEAYTHIGLETVCDELGVDDAVRIGLDDILVRIIRLRDEATSDGDVRILSEVGRHQFLRAKESADRHMEGMLQAKGIGIDQHLSFYFLEFGIHITLTTFMVSGIADVFEARRDGGEEAHAGTQTGILGNGRAELDADTIGSHGETCSQMSKEVVVHGQSEILCRFGRHLRTHPDSSGKRKDGNE